MTSLAIHPYRHSGKFPLVSPVAALVVGAVASLPLGLAYGYLIKWIPFIYINFFITLGYGFAFGMVAVWVMKRAKVRNTFVAALTALLIGLCALYGEWNGHLHALIDEAPLISTPSMLWGLVEYLYENGSWGISKSGNITGVVLAIVWLIEAGMIVGVTMLTVIGILGATPFCEQNQCWLDQERKLDTLGPFTDAAQLALLKAGDITPLLDAKPREAGSPDFVRVTLKSSPRCDTFCTMELESVSVEKNAKGELKEKKSSLTERLVLPHEMRDLVEKFVSFETVSTAVPATPPPETPATV